MLRVELRAQKSPREAGLNGLGGPLSVSGFYLIGSFKPLQRGPDDGQLLEDSCQPVQSGPQQEDDNGHAKLKKTHGPLHSTMMVRFSIGPP